MGRMNFDDESTEAEEYQKNRKECGDRVIVALDPGTTETAYLVMRDGKIGGCFGLVPNIQILSLIRLYGATVVCEEIRSYGMAVGKETFECCYWIGRFWGFCAYIGVPFYRVGRKEVVMHWCMSPRATDANVRRALIDWYGEPGTKKHPGPTHGITKHVWSALAIAGYWYQNPLLIKCHQNT
jgi:hypothetical protein